LKEDKRQGVNVKCERTVPGKQRGVTGTGESEKALSKEMALRGQMTAGVHRESVASPMRVITDPGVKTRLGGTWKTGVIGEG